MPICDAQPVKRSMPRSVFAMLQDPDGMLPPIARWLLRAEANYQQFTGQKITQEKLAEDSGIDTTYVGQIEKGKKTPSVKVVRALAKALTDGWADWDTAHQVLQDGLYARRVQTEGEIVSTEKENKNEPFLDQIREAGVIEDLPPETQEEILDFLRFKSEQARRKRDGNKVSG